MVLLQQYGLVLVNMYNLDETESDWHLKYVLDLYDPLLLINFLQMAPWC
jgi:hypothetical protein